MLMYLQIQIQMWIVKTKIWETLPFKAIDGVATEYSEESE